MSEDFMSLVPRLKEAIEVRPMPPVEPPAQAQPPLSPEQIAAVDAAFTGPREEDLAAGMLVLWANVPFLYELTREHFPGREEEAEQEQREPRDEEEPGR
jgi:hypothetical protein